MAGVAYAQEGRKDSSWEGGWRSSTFGRMLALGYRTCSDIVVDVDDKVAYKGKI